MTASSLYNLTWGEYGTSLISAVQLLRCHDELVDVTLAAGGRSFHAHKVVLCAASPFLLDLLKSTSCKHPVVMLAGVQASDLEALLEFVYRGEVSIDPNQLPSLLQAAHCLNIQGLAPSMITLNQDSTPSDIKTEMQKSDEAAETYFQESDMTFKRKKRAKRLARSPTAPLGKWPKVYITETADNVLVQSQDDNSNSWSQQMNLVNVSTATTTVEGLPLQTPILLQNVPVSMATTIPAAKIRGASDQPGACPLCGAMLRQARNLRRHLITSCKYRMVSSSNLTTTTNVDRVQEGQLQQMQTITLQNLPQNSLEEKPTALTPVSCTDLLPTSSNLINMTTSLQ